MFTSPTVACLYRAADGETMKVKETRGVSRDATKIQCAQLQKRDSVLTVHLQLVVVGDSLASLERLHALGGGGKALLHSVDGGVHRLGTSEIAQEAISHGLCFAQVRIVQVIKSTITAAGRKNKSYLKMLALTRGLDVGHDERRRYEANYIICLTSRDILQ